MVHFVPAWRAVICGIRNEKSTTLENYIQEHFWRFLRQLEARVSVICVNENLNENR